MKRRNIKQAEGNNAERLFRLFLRVYQAHDKISLDEFTASEWGDERTFRRTRNMLNDLWNLHRGCDLFHVVDVHGREVLRGERFLKLADTDFRNLRAVNIAVMPAFLQFMRLLKGTLLEEEFTKLYSAQSAKLSKKEKAFLARTAKKFYFLGKGVKEYSRHQEVLDTIYNAVLQEQVLHIQRRASSGIVKEVLRPLTILMFNNGLYLLAHRDGQKASEEPLTFRVETIIEAESSRKETFKYPENYDPAHLFEGSFGMIRGKESIDVEVEIKEGRAQEYIRSRKWTNWDRYKEGKGRLVMSFKVSDLSEVQSWVLGFADQVKVIRPKRLRDDVAAATKAMAALYR